jgi:Protein of unknown function (DUF3592)
MDYLKLIADIAFRLMGVCLALTMLHRLVKGFQSRRWVAIQGEVVSYSILQGNHGYASALTYYAPHISYKYMINGSEYYSNNFSHRFGQAEYPNEARCSSYNEAIKFVLARYPIRSAIKVFYNPKDPKQSVLKPGITWVDIFFDLVFSYVGIGLIFGGNPFLFFKIGSSNGGGSSLRL